MFSSPTDSSFLRAAASQSSIRLKEVRDRLDSVVDYVVDGIITIDDGGLIETLNPAAEKLFNYSAAELLGRSVSLLVSAPRESGDQADGPDEAKIRVAEIAGTGREVVGRRKDGSIFPIDLAVSSFSRAGRQFFTGIIRDISERKKLEFEQQGAHERLQEANERLRSVVDYVVDAHRHDRRAGNDRLVEPLGREDLWLLGRRDDRGKHLTTDARTAPKRA